MAKTTRSSRSSPRRSRKKSAKDYRSPARAADAVLNGRIPKTSGGLSARHLKRNAHGRAVSKAKSAQAKRSPKLRKWLADVARASDELNVNPIVLADKGHPKHNALKKLARELYRSR
tara:strand:+ start:1075 stop:1425 length:351 start_codon:yes stop_codon:yes gene_type:complete